MSIACSQFCQNSNPTVCGTKLVCRHGVLLSTKLLLNDAYADPIIDDESLFDGIEIHGVRDTSTSPSDGSCFEVDNQDPDQFSVYVHLVEGGVECVGDFGTATLAAVYATQLADRHHWPISDFTQVSTVLS